METEVFERTHGLKDIPEVEKTPWLFALQWPVIQLGKRFNRIITAHRQFFDIKPSDLKEMYLAKSDAADARGDTVDFVRFMEKAAQLSPKDPEVLYRLGVAREKNRDFDAALETYRKTVKLKEAHAKAHYRIGFILLRKRGLKDAVKSFEEALKYEPRSADLFFRLGQAYDRLQDHAKAISFFNKAVEIEDDFLPAYKHMALTYDSMNKHKEALECLKRALELEEMS